MKKCITAQENILCVPESLICEGYVDCLDYEMDRCKMNVEISPLRIY